MSPQPWKNGFWSPSDQAPARLYEVQGDRMGIRFLSLVDYPDIDCEFPSTLAFGNYGRTRKAENTISYEVASMVNIKPFVLNAGTKSRGQLELTITTFMSATVCPRFLRLKSLAWSMMMEAKLWSGVC